MDISGVLVRASKSVDLKALLATKRLLVRVLVLIRPIGLIGLIGLIGRTRRTQRTTVEHVITI
jgi:hypothetical protein